MIVETSDTWSELPTSSFSNSREGFVGNYTGPPRGRVGTSDPRSELPTQLKTAGRGPFVGRSKTLLMGVGTFDPGLELPAPTENFRISVKLCIMS